VEVAVGIDTHKRTLAAAAVDALGRVLDVREFSNDPKGHRSLAQWVKDRDQPRRVGIEGSMHYGAAAASRLLAEGEDVREVSPSLTHVERRRRSKGKSDPVDAVAIARVVAADEILPSAKRATLLADLKLLVDHHDQLVRARTQLANRVHADLVVMRPGYEQVVPNLRARRHVAKARSLVSRDRSVRGELVRHRLRDILRLEAEMAQADRRIADKLKETNTTLTQIPGVGPFIAAKILGEVGEVSRIRSKASFRSALGDGAPGRILRSNPSAPAEPKGEPSAELGPALHRPGPVPNHPRSKGLPDAPARRGKVPEGGDAMPQTAPVERRVPAPPGGWQEA